MLFRNCVCIPCRVTWRSELRFMEQKEHSRSQEASLRREQRRDARTFISNMAFHDFERGETVCLVDYDAVYSFLGMKYPFVLPSVKEEIERGEVLTDTRGTGTWQIKRDVR